MYTILATGVGAVIGYGIVRSLRAASVPTCILGMDIYGDAAGRRWCDAFEQAVPAAAPEYPAFLRDLLERYRVDLVIPGIEQDVSRMSLGRTQGSFSDLATKFALNAPELIEVARDKWVTHERLLAGGFPTIRTRIDGSFDELARELGLPMLLKPRTSYASKGIRPIRDERDFDYWHEELGDQFMVQQIVGDDDNEYTVGAFGLGDGTCSQQIAFQRRLSGEGATAKARSCKIPELERTVESLVAHFAPLGPTNFQFRFHDGQFLLLEVNPRVSSSTSLRTAFGYNEAEMCIEFYLDGKRPAPRQLRAGYAVRYIDEIVTYDRTDF